MNKENHGNHLGYLPLDIELFGGLVKDSIARIDNLLFQLVNCSLFLNQSAKVNRKDNLSHQFHTLKELL